MLTFRQKHSTEKKSVIFHYNFDEWEDVSKMSSHLSALFAYEDHQMVGQMILDWFPPDVVVYDFNIKPEYRRRGVGSALIKQLGTKYGAKSIRLSVRDKDPGLILFYQKNGFKIDMEETKRQNEANDEDKLWMSKNIS